MPEILTQKEIDALLSSLAKERKPEIVEKPPEERVIRPYDFSHFQRLSSDYRRILEKIHASFAKELGGYLTSRLVAEFKSRLVGINQVGVSEFINSFTTPCCIYVLQVQDSNREIFIEINPNLVLLIVDCLFGGPGRPLEELREITPLEQRVMRRILDYVLEILRRSWEDFAPLNIKTKAFYTNPDFVPLPEQGETMITASIEISYHERPTYFNISYPYSFLRDILAGFDSSNQRVSQRVPDYQDTAVIEKVLKTVKIPLRVILGETTINLKELVDLELGDVLPLDKKIDQDLKVLVGDSPKFYAHPGVISNRIAVKVTRVLKNGEV